jgi:hypothetical protein
MKPLMQVMLVFVACVLFGALVSVVVDFFGWQFGETQDNSSAEVVSPPTGGGVTSPPSKSPPAREPESKAVVRAVSAFFQTVPESRFQEELRKISVSESSHAMHQEAARFSVGLSRNVELEAMEQQRMHIVELCDTIIATFRELDSQYARVEQRVRNVNWDSSVERDSQLGRLRNYEELKRRYLAPAQATKSRYSR